VRILTRNGIGEGERALNEDRFGELLRSLRRGVGLSQEDLAAASGSSVRTIRELEQGRVRTPQRRTTLVVADALGLDGEQRSRFLALATKQRFVDADARASRTAPTDPPGAPPAYGARPASRQPAIDADEHPSADGRGQVPRQLPAPVADLVGRSGQLTAIRQLAEDVSAGRRTTTSLVVIHGPPGVGKTSLAVTAAHELSPRFPGGQLFVDLQGAAEAGPLASADVLAGFLRSLGVPDATVPASAGEREGLFRTLARDRRMLIVLDNACDEAQVRPLLPAAPNCLVLATCRRPLTGLEAADRIVLDVLERADARRMLTAIVGPERAAADPAAVDQLVRLCGRWPIALRIAGNRLASRPRWSARHLLDRLRDQRRRLSVLTAGDLDVRAAFAVSYRQLDTVPAAVFRSAAVIPGPDFDAGMAAAAAGIDEEEATQALEELVDAGLLLWRGDRYGFHDLVRLYARERLDEDPEEKRASAHHRVVVWLLGRTRRAGLAFEPGSPPGMDHRQARAWLERESVNWLVALRDAARYGRHDDVVRVARALHWYSDATTHRHPWDEIFSLGVAAARAAGNRSDEAVLLNFLGWARYFCRDRNADGLAAHAEALAVARAIGNRREEAWALTYTASIHVRTGRTGEAVAPARRAIILFARDGYPLGENSARTVLGIALAHKGRHTEALDLHREVLAFYRGGAGLTTTGAQVAQASALMCLAEDLAGLGRLADAAATVTEAEDIFARTGARFHEGAAAYRRGLALQALGDVTAAGAALRHALVIFNEVPGPLWEARVLVALATLAEDPRPLRERALDRCDELDAPEARALRATVLRELADRPASRVPSPRRRDP
jgi:transcriptional regulator with XRE-family HTH domain/tetratricopeptide (TPR) repeat protein